ncbi:MAG: glycosyltransferase [Candidatus Micrarchaeia archaeon]
MEKALFVSTHALSKLGGVRRLYYNLEYFSREFEVHFIHVSLPGARPAASLDIPKNVKFTEISAGKLSFDPASLLMPMVAKRQMLIRSAKKQVQGYIDSNGIDAVVLHALDASFAFRDIRAKAVVMDQLDSFHTYYESKHAFSKTPLTFLLMHFQKASYSIVERLLDRNCGIAAFVSAADAKRSAFRRAQVIASEIRQPPEKTRKIGRKNDVVVFGRWEHPPNRDGIARIAGRLGEIKGSVLVIGPNLNAGLELPANARVAGFVDDIEAALSDSKLCLIPVWYGAGLQNKVFDALRCGCGVVSTQFTRMTFDANGFASGSVSYSDDVITEANRRLAAWSEKEPEKAYESYSRWYEKTVGDEKEYVGLVKRALEKRRA